MSKKILLFVAIIVVVFSYFFYTKTNETQEPPQITFETFGFIRALQIIDVTTLLFDDAQFLNGKEAQDAAIKAGICTEETREECTPNDYFIENTSTSTKTLSVAPEALVYMETYKTGIPGDAEEVISLTEFAELINNPALHWKNLPYHLMIQGEEIILIREQYIP